MSALETPPVVPPGLVPGERRAYVSAIGGARAAALRDACGGDVGLYRRRLGRAILTLRQWYAAY